jgi:hypothetical protein
LSAILEALRRVEREAPSLGVKSMPHKVDPRKTFRHRIRRIWFARRALRLLFVFFVLAISGWALARILPLITIKINRGPTPEINYSAEAGDKTRANQVALNKSGQINARFPSEKSRWTEQAKRSDREGIGSFSSGGKSAKSLPKDIEPEKKRSQRFPAGIKVISPGNADSTFKLEALVWSTDPGSRFAVINGQIVKAGQSIQGASVAEIERDYVALKSGDQTWRLRIQALP